jgi:hypothetical protein
MYGLPEVNLFVADTYWHLLRRYNHHKRFQHGLLRAIAELGLEAQTVKTVATALAWLEENSQVNTADLFRYLAKWADPRALVDGSRIYVVDSTALGRVRNAFPKARYMHLVRSVRSTCDSMRKSLAKQNLSPERLWLIPHLEIMEFLQEIPAEQHLRLRVEDLFAAPDLYLTQIADWLKIRTDFRAISTMKHPEHSPFACYGPINARYGNDSEFLANPQFRTNQTRPQNSQSLSGQNRRQDLTEELQFYSRFFGYN